MPIRFVCKNTSKKLKQGEIRDQAGNCFKKGIRVGFAVGLNKALKKQAKIKPILQEMKEKGLFDDILLKLQGLHITI